jgi:hypothetical protein
MDDNNGLQNIKKMYEKLTYFDQYGASVIIFFVITLILVLLISYFHTLINIQPIINDWPNQRCKPSIIPFAGLISKPDGMTVSEYTYQNFNYCTQNILSGITGQAVEPLSFITKMLGSVGGDIEESIQAIRSMFDKMREFFINVSKEIMGRLMNVMIPLQQIIISFRDMVSKMQGTMTTGLFTLLGSYYTLKSLLGAIAQFLVIVLISLAAMIAIFWIFPFTWGAAISSTAIFVAISIPFAIILAFMSDVLKINTNLTIPSIPTMKCFDKGTLITMSDGTQKKIIDIIVGDLLSDNNEVTAKIKVERKGSVMYKLDNIIVSDSHIIKYDDDLWIQVSEHSDAIRIDDYDDEYLYCLNTENKEIKIGERIFTDWDEVYGNDINELKNNGVYKFDLLKDIHRYLDSGFGQYTQIKLKNGDYKNIRDIVVGDTLYWGEKVYGTVEINGLNVDKQYTVNLGDNFIVEGGPNFTGFDKFSNLKVLPLPNEKLYHLLTNEKCFYVGNSKFYDYNAAIDLLLEKNRVKLLSMKYV